MSFAVSGDPGATQAVFTYPVHQNLIGSVIYVYNREKGVGIIQDANPDGSVGPTAPVRADLGDQIVVSFQREEQTSSTCIRLRSGLQDPNTPCDP